MLEIMSVYDKTSFEAIHFPPSFFNNTHCRNGRCFHSSTLELASLSALALHASTT